MRLVEQNVDELDDSRSSRATRARSLLSESLNSSIICKDLIVNCKLASALHFRLNPGIYNASH